MQRTLPPTGKRKYIFQTLKKLQSQEHDPETQQLRSKVICHNKALPEQPIYPFNDHLQTIHMDIVGSLTPSWTIGTFTKDTRYFHWKDNLLVWVCNLLHHSRNRWRSIFKPGWTGNTGCVDLAFPLSLRDSCFMGWIQFFTSSYEHAIKNYWMHVIV